MTELIALFGTSQIQCIVILIMIDVVLGIIAALVKGNFRLGKLAKFMVKPVLGYVLGFVVLQIVVLALPSLIIVAQMAYVLVVLALVGSVFNNLAKMGLPVPNCLRRD